MPVASNYVRGRVEKEPSGRNFGMGNVERLSRSGVQKGVVPMRRIDYSCFQFLRAGIVVLTLTSGCAINTVTPEYQLPSQSINAPSEPGRVRLLLFNDSNRFLYGLDGSGKINVKLAGKNVASLEIGTFVQLFVDPGQYDLLLAHRDMVTFESSHRLAVQGDAMFVKVYSQPVSTDLEILNTMPVDFADQFRPALP